MHVSREVDDQTTAKRLAHVAGARSPSDERRVGCRGIIGQGDDVVTMLGEGHAQRRDLVEAAIACVHGNGQRVASDLSVEHSGEVFSDASALFVHTRPLDTALPVAITSR